METQITDWGTAMMTSLTGAMAMFFSAIPKILGFTVIVIVGWLLASLVEKGVAAILRAVRFNDLAARSGLADFVNKMGTGTDSSGMIGLVVKWFIRLIALVVAFDALGLPAVSDVLRQLLLWLPNVVVALVVLVIGGLAFGLGGKDAAADIVRNWYAKAREKSGQLERAGDAVERRIGESDRRTAENAAAFKERGPQMNPGPANKRHESEGG